jgi:hypothetical protein
MQWTTTAAPLMARQERGGAISFVIVPDQKQIERDPSRDRSLNSNKLQVIV